MQTFWQDLRYGARILFKQPGFTLIALITLALGIGANTAIFSLVNTVLLRPLPFAAPERLVWAWGEVSGGNRAFTSPPDFLDYRAQNRSIEALAAMRFRSFNLTGSGEPERVIGRQVTANFFQTLGVKPIQGRAFAPEEEQAGRAQVVIIGQGLWQRRFGGEAEIIGKTISLDGRNHTVVGVAPDTTQVLQEAEMWTPLTFDQPDMKVRRAHFADDEPLGQRLIVDMGEPWTCEIIGVARDTTQFSLASDIRPMMYLPSIRTGVAVIVVRTSGDPLALTGAVRAAVREVDRDQPIANLRSLEQILSSLVGEARFRTLLLGVFAAVALLLAGIGIYGVLAYSVAQRTHEIGIRLALGARTGDVLELVIGQGMKLTLLGAGVGIAGALALTSVLSSLLFNVSATDPLTFAAGSLLLTLVALLACWIPAWRATKVDPMIALRCE